MEFAVSLEKELESDSPSLTLWEKLIFNTGSFGDYLAVYGGMVREFFSTIFDIGGDSSELLRSSQDLARDFYNNGEISRRIKTWKVFHEWKREEY